MLLIGRFLLQKNMLLMHLILLDLLRHIFPVKFPPNIALKTSHQLPASPSGAMVPSWGIMGRDTAFFYSCAQVRSRRHTRQNGVSNDQRIYWY